MVDILILRDLWFWRWYLRALRFSSMWCWVVSDIWRNLVVASLRVIFVDCLILEGKELCSLERCNPVVWWHNITAQKSWGLLKLILVRLQFAGMQCHSLLGCYRHFIWTQCLHYQGTRLIACACGVKAITDCTGREERQGEWRNSVGPCSESENSVWK
jgi:hypothetical protein